MRLEGRRAFITGGSSGIGKATARLFSAEGARVVIVGREEAKLEQAAEELGGGVIALIADVCEPDALNLAAQTAATRLGSIDIVFANAGIGGATPVGNTELKDFERILKTNVTGSFFTIQAVLPYLRAGSSVILNGSIQSDLGPPRYAAYAASKAGVRAMTRVLASELILRGIRVNAVTPGPTNTSIWASSGASQEECDELILRVRRSIPFGRFATAEEVARAVLFLASDESSYMHGAEIVVDGGSVASPAGAPIYRIVQHENESND